MRIIENVTDDFAHCKDEQAFKKLYCVSRLKQRGAVTVKQSLFYIETEETVAGFPDVMELTTFCGKTTARFFEFKISDNRGNIKFQPTQPSFFKQNYELDIKVVAYNRVSKRVHVFSTNEIFDKNSPYYTNSGRINLCTVEKEIGV